MVFVRSEVSVFVLLEVVAGERGTVAATSHTDPMARAAGCPPQRIPRAADTLEIWDPRGSADIVDWRRVALLSESALAHRGALDIVLAEVNDRRPDGPRHDPPPAVAWLPLTAEAAGGGWRWGLIVDDRLLLPTRPVASWVEFGQPPPQASRAGHWWRVTAPDDHWAEWYVAGATLNVAVRRALHGAAPLDTAVAVMRSQIRHQLLVAIVAATPPERPPIRLAVQDLGGRTGPSAGLGCLLDNDLEDATNLCA